MKTLESRQMGIIYSVYNIGPVKQKAPQSSQQYFSEATSETNPICLQVGLFICHFISPSVSKDLENLSKPIKSPHKASN